MKKENQALTPSKSIGSLMRIGNYGTRILGLVMGGMKYPIRKLGNDVVLAAKLQELSVAYGAREGMEDVVLRECIQIVKTRFSMLGLDELTEAFRMAASGELVGVKVEVYGGMWNAAIIGRVLGGYRDYRRQVMNAIVKSEENMAKASRAKRLKAKEANTKLYAEFMTMVEEKGAKYSSWQEVPVYWYGIAMKLGLIAFEGDEVQRIYAWAMSAAKSELQRQLASAPNAMERKSYQTLLDAFEQGNMSRAKLISRKVAVWMKLLGGKMEF